MVGAIIIPLPLVIDVEIETEVSQLLPLKQ